MCSHPPFDKTKTGAKQSDEYFITIVPIETSITLHVQFNIYARLKKGVAGRLKSPPLPS
jgi:hypothetical protein